MFGRFVTSLKLYHITNVALLWTKLSLQLRVWLFGHQWFSLSVSKTFLQTPNNSDASKFSCCFLVLPGVPLFTASTYILNVNIYSERQLPSLLISSRLWIVSAIFLHFSTISSLDPEELLRKTTEYIPFAASSPPQSLVALFLFFSEECAFTNSLNTFIRRDSRIVTKFCNSSKLISVSCFSLASAVSASFGSLSVETFSSLSTLNEPMYSKALFVAKRYSKAVCKIRMVDDDPP